MMIVRGGGDKRRGAIVGDRMTEKGRGVGKWVETFELHKITSLPTFVHPRASKGMEHIPHASWVSGCAVSAMISSCSGPNTRGD